MRNISTRQRTIPAALLAPAIGAIAITICSCHQQPSKHNAMQMENDQERLIDWRNGLRIVNGINRGTDYVDSRGTKYNLRYIPIIITNVSTSPIQLQLDFAKEYDYPSPYDDERFNVMPMPKEWGMDGVEITERMIHDLLKYIENPSMTKTLAPGETFVAAIGTRYLPTGRGMVPNALIVQRDSREFRECDDRMNHDASNDAQIALGLKLNFGMPGHRDPVGCVLISCGQIAFPESQTHRQIGRGSSPHGAILILILIAQSLWP